MAEFDYLIVGAGLYGAVFAHEMCQKGKKCLVVDKRGHIGGNVYTEDVEGIQVHRYGAHIFHTSDKEVWDYVNGFAEFNRYINSPVARYKDELYNLPFNMNTFYALWGVKTPEEAKAKIEEQKAEALEARKRTAGKDAGDEPSNLEEQAIALAGRDIYEKLVKGYTEKQWGKRATELPPFIIKRLPVRFTFDNNYFNDRYQGIPIGGYTAMIEKMLEGSEVRLNVDYLENRAELNALADKIVYTGMIDAFFDHRFGYLEYRSLRFETEILNMPNFQGNAVVNYTEYEVPYTRIIEHKHFEFGTQDMTVITREYPAAWKQGDEPYYPMNDAKNTELFEKYKALADKEEKVLFGGRLGEYRYYDMHQVIRRALDAASEEGKRIQD
ncbi:MAG: UDP-galactopyranose mutase [Lachnospiraceae bacterium]|nr:UDP-galactopyranose mutase [Lachnospiraceae bacterium]